MIPLLVDLIIDSPGRHEAMDVVSRPNPRPWTHRKARPSFVSEDTIIQQVIGWKLPLPQVMLIHAFDAGWGEGG